MKDYYAILGIDAAAEESLIKAAYQVKTQLYHPKKFSGDPAEAVARMADIKEAFAVLKNPSKRKAYDIERGAPTVNLKDDESNPAARMDIPELPQIRAESFSCPVFVIKPKIRLAKARALFTEKFVASETKLPDGTSIENVANSANFVYVPSWLISGSAFGEWRANGIKTIDCAQCDGKGTLENKENTQPCPACHGTGKTNQHKDKGHAESGTARAVVEEHVPSVIAGVEFNLDFSVTAKPVKATPVMVADLYCLQPEHDYKKAKAILNERLAVALRNKALSDLAAYDVIENLHFGSTEVYLFNKVELWLHPFYVCWYEKRGRKQFAICDGFTGKVTLPQHKFRWDLFRNLLLAAGLGLGLLLYLGSALLLHSKTAVEAGSPAIAPYNKAIDDNIFKQLLAEKPGDDGPANDEPVSGKPAHNSKSANTTATARESTRSRTMDGTGSLARNPGGNIITSNKYGFPLDCTKASIKAEKLICSSKELTNEDRKMGEIFELKKNSTFFEIFRKQMEFEQANWVENVRNACMDEACLSSAYHKRIDDLSPVKQAKQSEVCPIPGHCH